MQTYAGFLAAQEPVDLPRLRALGQEMTEREQDRLPSPDADLLEHNRWIGELRGRRRQVVPAHSPYTRMSPEEEFRTKLDDAIDEDLRRAEAHATSERLRRKRGLIELMLRKEPRVSLATHSNTVMGWPDFQVDAMWPLASDLPEPTLAELQQREYDLYVQAYRQAPPDPRARLKLAPPAPTRPEQFAAIEELQQVRQQIAEREHAQAHRPAPQPAAEQQPHTQERARKIGRKPGRKPKAREIASLRGAIADTLSTLRATLHAEPTVDEVADHIGGEDGPPDFRGLNGRMLNYRLRNWIELIDPEWHWQPTEEILATRHAEPSTDAEFVADNDQQELELNSRRIDDESSPNSVYRA